MMEVEKSGALNSPSRMVPRNWNTTQSYTVYALLEKELLCSCFGACAIMCYPVLSCAIMCYHVLQYKPAMLCLNSVPLGVKPMRSLAKFFGSSAKDKLMSEIEALRSSSRLQPHAQVAEAGTHQTSIISCHENLEADCVSDPNQYTKMSYVLLCLIGLSILSC